MEKTFYEKILVSSGEVPEEEGVYHTSQVYNAWNGKEWIITHGVIEWWMKPIPSPKQEALDFAEWIMNNDNRIQIGQIGNKNNFLIDGWPVLVNGLYDKFKEKGEK